VAPRLCPVRTPPALGSRLVLRPIQVLAREVVPCLQLENLEAGLLELLATNLSGRGLRGILYFLLATRPPALSPLLLRDLWLEVCEASWELHWSSTMCIRLLRHELGLPIGPLIPWDPFVCRAPPDLDDDAGSGPP